MFFFWNNGRLIINVRQIRIIEVIEYSEEIFAYIHFIDHNPMGISREIYNHLIKHIQTKPI